MEPCGTPHSNVFEDEKTLFSFVLILNMNLVETKNNPFPSIIISMNGHYRNIEVYSQTYQPF